ncbi:MAG: chorismate synthase [Marinifilaceae bacterium]|jgi:chorismate synthase|nr:chorismate synthase [Marinifilaceae bacterium]
MTGNTFGDIYSITSFGESHGISIGGIINGFPSGIFIDEDFIQKELDRRRPGQSPFATSRNEGDKLEIQSGIFEGKSTGAPIGFIVKNNNQKSKDYSSIKNIYRPSHADYTWDKKYGIRDYRGGGRSSAREHIARVVAGAFAKLFLKQFDIKITAYTYSVGEISIDYCDFTEINNPISCPNINKAEEMMQLITSCKSENDSVGCVVACIIENLPVGLGEPVFDKFSAYLSHAMMSINAAKGFEIGEGFNLAKMRGSVANDSFYNERGKIRTKTNYSGGTLGGITNGENVDFKVAFKPIPTISKEQNTVDNKGRETTINVQGRHDSCAITRAIPVVEAMSAIVVMDLLLKNRLSKN